MWRLYLATIQNAIKPSMFLRRRRLKMTLKFLSVFNGCHTDDEADVTYDVVIKNQLDSKCAQDWKESSMSSS
eukprot:2487457-Ditylum_brightwellii.AAC.1